MSSDRTDLKWSDLQYNGWRQVEKTITFDGGTTDAIGDDGGALDPFTIFTVTGVVTARVFGVCSVNGAGTGTLAVGTAITPAGFLAATTATDIDAGEILQDATPDASVELATVAPEKIVAQDIIGTVGTADITAGVIKFICLWKPLSSDGNVVAA